MATRERTIDLPNGPMRVRERGEGPALIWTHGVFHPIDVDDHSTLGRVINELEGYRVIRYDTRGHGRTPAAPTVAQHHWHNLGAELLALADALGLDRFVAGGISMGAAVTLHAARTAPERFRGLVLLAPPTGWELRPKEQENYRAMAQLGGPADLCERVAARVQREFEEAFGRSDLPPALRVMIDTLRTADPVALQRVLESAAESDLPPREAVARIMAPTLIMPWEGDPGHPMQTARAIAACLPGSLVREVAGFEDAIGIARELREFLAVLP